MQNAVSLVIGIASIKALRLQTIIACPRGGPVHKACQAHGLTVAPIRAGLVGRIIFELGGGAWVARRNRASIVFTLFGNAPLVSPGLYRISGFALSNILTPEVDFWQDFPPVRRTLKKLKDGFRLWLAQRSHEIIVETDFLAERARNGPFRDRIVHVVKMEPSAAVLEALADRPQRGRASEMRLLALAGPHPNKRLAAMAPIMARLKALRSQQGKAPPELLISIDGAHPQAKAISAAFEAAAAPPPRFIGNVPPTDVGALLQKVDGIINIARLESFSNNWVEAWAAGIPLISTDADWARASCGQAAIYVDPNQPEQAAERIDKAYSSPETLRALALAGNLQLSELGVQGSKIDRYAQIVMSAIERD
ncbi:MULTISPECIES: glycosyltransferase [unclassified Aliiroseovarius]|uniref:glycosyltransferase n=1 Tax=unclassified Aliiroseovarius TaxID=2623558 RepID=UPI001569FB2C|nr:MULTISPECIES: glycosyltransferase [unclassified Aliiroseovarius]